MHCHTHIIYSTYILFINLLHFGHLEFGGHDLLRVGERKREIKPVKESDFLSNAKTSAMQLNS